MSEDRDRTDATSNEARKVVVPYLETERLVLTLPSADDAPALIAYARRNEEPHRPWSPPTPPNAFSEEATQRRIRQTHDELQAGTGVRFWMRQRRAPRGPFVGALNLSNIVLGAFRCARVGYHIDCGHEGQGLMSEGLRAVIGYAFEVRQLHRLEANFVPTNERSARVLERAGFVVEGYARKYLFIGGAYRDHVLTSLTNAALERPPDVPAAR